MVDLLNACMKDEMRRNPKMLIFGQDVADASREASLPRVKGKGGVFKVTWGLQKEFGGDARLQLAARRSEHRRPRDRARGARLQARRRDPVLRLHLAGVHADPRRARDDALALQQCVRRARRDPGDVRRLHPRRAVSLADGRVAVHALPGTARHLPVHALDANGLLRTAIRCDDPVIFLEHKHLYRQTYNKAVNPGPDFMIPFGKARVVRAGTDCTIVTYGATVQRAFAAANQMHEEHGIDAEVIDLRSLSPWDSERVYESVKRTSRVIVAYEDSISWGYGAEIAARIADDCFAWLDAPVKRVASTDTFVGYAPRLEDAILPQVDDFKRAIAD